MAKSTAIRHKNKSHKRRRSSDKRRVHKKSRSRRRRNMAGRGCPCQLGAQTKREIPTPTTLIGGLQMGGNANACAGAVPLLGGGKPVQQGGDVFPIRSFYPLNAYNHDPNYYQISERAIPQMNNQTGRCARTMKRVGKRASKRRNQGGGGMITDITNSVSNAFSNTASGISNLVSDTGNGLSSVLTSIPNPILGTNLSKSAILSQGTILGAGVSNNIMSGQTIGSPERISGIYDLNHLPKA